MGDNIKIFCIIVAVIIVVTRLILEFSMERDRNRGVPIKAEEYKFRPLLRMAFRDIGKGIKRVFCRRPKRVSARKVKEE